MKFVIAISNETAYPRPRWDVADPDLLGSVIDGEFVVPFGSWDAAARTLTAVRDKARAIANGTAEPDAFHEIMGGD